MGEPGQPGMNAKTTEVASSHVVMLSQPQAVIDVIQNAVKAVSGSSTGDQWAPPK
jgi:hypothetical protein